MIILYAATRNLYRHLPAAIRSLMHYNAAHVKKIVILAEDDHTPAYEAMLYGVTKLQIAGNMPVTIGDVTAAADAIEMVALQNKMEAEAPENISPDRKSIN